MERIKELEERIKELETHNNIFSDCVVHGLKDEIRELWIKTQPLNRILWSHCFISSKPRTNYNVEDVD